RFGGTLPTIRGTRPRARPPEGRLRPHPSFVSVPLRDGVGPPVPLSRYLLGDRVLPPSAKPEDQGGGTGGSPPQSRSTQETEPEDRGDGTSPRMSRHRFLGGMRSEDLSAESRAGRLELDPSPPRNRRHPGSKPADGWSGSGGRGERCLGSSSAESRTGAPRIGALRIARHLPRAPLLPAKCGASPSSIVGCKPVRVRPVCWSGSGTPAGRGGSLRSPESGG